jgi:hypothetical protein
MRFIATGVERARGRARTLHAANANLVSLAVRASLVRTVRQRGDAFDAFDAAET